MNWRFAVPITGVLLAILITSTMDASGLTVFSALPLLPLFALLWFVEKFSRREIGLVLGRARDYGLALLYPGVVLGIVSLVAVTAGGGHVAAGHWQKALTIFAAIAASTVLGALLTEEGFFRGWLWASLRKRAMPVSIVLVCTSLVFAFWHLSYVTLASGYTLPPVQVAIFIVNAVFMGAIWGLLRAISGSIVVSSVSHAIWNGAAYAFYGEGPKSGPLGLPNTIVFGPEIGVVGLAANVVFFMCLYVWTLRLPRTAE